MDRKWRTNRQAFNDVLSLLEFKTFLREAGGDPSLMNSSSLTDLYAVYTVLHIEGASWELHWSPEHNLHYFTTRKRLERGAQGLHAPEGDEDVEIIVADPDQDDSSGRGDSKIELIASPSSKEASSSGNAIVEQEELQLLIPFGSDYASLTPQKLHQVCKLGHGKVHQVILGLVDSHGVVTRCCMYDYIQAPLGGTGTAPLQR